MTYQFQNPTPPPPILCKPRSIAYANHLTVVGLEEMDPILSLVLDEMKLEVNIYGIITICSLALEKPSTNFGSGANI